MRLPPDPADPALTEAPDPFPLDRRGFLRGVAGGGLAIAVAGWLSSSRAVAAPVGGGLGSDQGERGSRALTRQEHAVLRAAAEALLERVPVDPVQLADRVDTELALIGDPVMTDVKTVLRLVERLTILSGRLRPFTSLDPAERLAYLQGWGTSRFNLRRASYQAIRTLVHFYGWSEDSTRPLTGYEGTWPERLDLPAYPVDFGGVA